MASSPAEAPPADEPPTCTIIGEIGINHNGDMDLCKKLIMASKVSGCKYAKIQKRNPGASAKRYHAGPTDAADAAAADDATDATIAATKSSAASN